MANWLVFKISACLPAACDCLPTACDSHGLLSFSPRACFSWLVITFAFFVDYQKIIAWFMSASFFAGLCFRRSCSVGGSV